MKRKIALEEHTPFKFHSLMSECLYHAEEAVSLAALELVAGSSNQVDLPLQEEVCIIAIPLGLWVY